MGSDASTPPFKVRFDVALGSPAASIAPCLDGRNCSHSGIARSRDSADDDDCIAF